MHADDDRLRRMAVFDVVLNNADRKGGHVLVEPRRRGATASTTACRFHVDAKLRTVLWGWAGRAAAADEVEVLERLRDGLLDGGSAPRSVELLPRHEVLRTAAAGSTGCCTDGRLPLPGEGWPAIPWPPF